jgi:exosortase A
MNTSTIDGRRLLGLAMLLGVLLLGLVHHATFLSIFAKWGSDAAYGHGYLILPIVLWLIWRKRTDLSALSMRPSWFGVAAVAGCSFVWLLAHGSGILVLEQFAAVAMLPSLVLAVLGWPVTRCLIFPLGFLFLAVPFGRGIVPWLMQLTADLSTLALQWSGIPVWRSHMHISIPAGSFEVAKACSGLKFFVAGLVLGVLYAYLNYRTWRKRLLCVAAFIVIPILLNSARVYITIAVSHLTDMRFGPGREHIAFGMVFFIVVSLLMFWIGRRWQDEMPAATRVEDPGNALSTQVPAVAWLAVASAYAAIVLGPILLESSVAHAKTSLADGRLLLRMPGPVGGWTGPVESEGRWRPDYRGGIAEGQVTYLDRESNPVDVFVAVFGLGNTHGAEMISYGNVIDAGDFGSLAPESVVRVPLEGGRSLKVRERVVDGGDDRRLVWYWYVVGDRVATSPVETKALEALALLTRGATSERVVVLSTAEGPGDRKRMEAFVTAYSQCVQTGFSPEACSG